MKRIAVRMQACTPQPSSDRRSPAAAIAVSPCARAWDDRFLEVERMLESIADGLGGPRFARGAAATCAEGQVRDCAATLSQLRAQAMAEFERRRQSDRDVLEMRAELVRSRADEVRARHVSLHDGLTSLPNRAFLQSRLEGMLSRPGPQDRTLAVLFVDLDDFKAINDAHGHAVCDALLRIVATRMSRTIREGDMVSRFGGDEFVCLLAGLPGREALSHLACKLLDAVSAPIDIAGLEVCVKPSIGIASWPEGGATPEELIRNADAAMYRAKRRRLGYSFFDEGEFAGAGCCA